MTGGWTSRGEKEFLIVYRAKGAVVSGVVTFVTVGLGAVLCSNFARRVGSGSLLGLRRNPLSWSSRTGPRSPVEP